MLDRESHTRMNIYLDDPAIRVQVKIAAAQRGVSMSAYCLDAIKERLNRDRADWEGSAANARRIGRQAALTLDEIRASVGPIGVPVSVLVAEGRSR